MAISGEIFAKKAGMNKSTGWMIGFGVLWVTVIAILVVLFQVLKVVGTFINKMEAAEENSRSFRKLFRFSYCICRLPKRMHKKWPIV
ncbi:hypothetical protein BP422_04095 [Brevibacillus formosus]|uniref:Uncharacterized protein n=1 Tax=Brevibacillus formosus TaxID=54913 RepID=A0A220MCU0_9BACL|nr:hypothetical protein BP422_04095 [Brevibacillus formosus]